MNKIEVFPQEGRLVIKELDRGHVMGEIWVELNQLRALIEALQALSQPEGRYALENQ